MRILYNTETGEATVQESRPSGARVSASVGGDGQEQGGMPVSISTAGPQGRDHVAQWIR